MQKLFWLSVLLLAASCAASQGDALDDASEPSDAMQVQDLLKGDVPEPLKAARQLEHEGMPLDLDTMRALYNFGKANPSDARPWLLLASDAMRSQEYGFAVRYYNMAIEADQRAAQHPVVREDLLEVVRVCAGATEQAEARALIKSRYGAAILEQVRLAIEDALADDDIAGAERLQALLNTLDNEPKAGPRLKCFAGACAGFPAGDQDR